MRRSPHLALLALFALPAAARAERWVLVPTDATAASLAERLRAPLAARVGHVELASDVSARLPPPVEPAPEATAGALAAAIEGAIRRTYFHRDPRVAIGAVAEAVREGLALLPRLASRNALWNAVRRGILLQALHALQERARERALELCQQVAARDEAYAPPEADWPPSLRAVYAEAKARLPGERAILEVQGPAGMKVFVDRLARGTAPLRIEVALGPHEVQGLHGGVLAAPQTVTVPANGARVTLEPACALARNLVTPACREFLRRASGAGVLAELAVAGATLEIQLHRGESPARRIALEAPARASDKWLGELADFLSGRRAQPPVVEVKVVRVPVPAVPLHKRWWFWTLIGVAVAGGTAALLYPRPHNLDLVVSRP
jgi:hypothetical protein